MTRPAVLGTRSDKNSCISAAHPLQDARHAARDAAKMEVFQSSRVSVLWMRERCHVSSAAALFILARQAWPRISTVEELNEVFEPATEPLNFPTQESTLLYWISLGRFLIHV